MKTTEKQKFQIASWHLQRKYGITAEEKRAMWVLQGKICVICKEKMKSWRKAHVDHDHRTKQVRGLLCNDCNIGLGWFKDSPEICENAALYLVSFTKTASSPLQ